MHDSKLQRSAPWWVAAVLACVWGCGGEEPPAASASGASSGAGGGDTTPCAPGEAPFGDGCRAAGLPPDWVEPGPAAEPQAGVPPDACGAGFDPDGEGGCTPILPAEPCTDGMIALPGETACHEIAPCGAGAWGDIPVEPTTQYVDLGYAGGDGDGTAAKPWTTIQAAIDAAAPGAIVAVAAGSYAETVVVDTKPVRLWGRCPSLVELVWPTDDFQVLVRDVPAGAEVRGLALRGGAGVAVARSPGALLDRLWIHDTSNIGAFLVELDESAQEMVFSQSLVERAAGAGLLVGGTVLRMEGLTVRDTEAWSDGTLGHGIEVDRHPDTGQSAHAVLSGSVVERNSGAGVLALSSELTVEDTFINETRPNPAGDSAGWGVAILDVGEGPASAAVKRSVIAASADAGIDAHGAVVTVEDTVVRDAAGGEEARIGVSALPGLAGTRATLAVARSLLANNADAGVRVRTSDATVESVLVRGTHSARVDDGAGVGILVYGDKTPEDAADVVVRSSIVEGSRAGGVVMFASVGLIEDTVVRDLVPTGIEPSTAGIAAESMPGAPGARLTVRRCRVERSRGYGLYVLGSEATFESTLVTDTLSRQDGSFGIGLTAGADPETGAPSTVVLTGSLIEKSRELGVVASASTITIEATAVRDTAGRDADGQFGQGISIQDRPSRGATATIRWSVVERNHSGGILIIGSEATVEGTLVTDGLPEAASQASGACVGAIQPEDTGRRSKLTFTGSRIQRCPQAGLVVGGSDAVVDGVLVNDISPQADNGRFGRGITTQDDSTLVIGASSIERCVEGGITILRGAATIDQTSVTNTLPRADDGFMGDGIDAIESEVTVRRSHVGQSARAGIAAFGSKVSIADTVLACNPIDLDAEVHGSAGSFEDGGGNTCGCDGDEVACVAKSSLLEPPEPLPP